MIAENSTKAELISALHETFAEMQGLMVPLTEELINTVPFGGSWTAGQLFSHVIKSTAGITGAISGAASPADRHPGKRIAELKEMFLDLSTKMQSPDFIVPDEGPFQKEKVSAALYDSLDELEKAAQPADLNGLVAGLPFGPVTKLELLHFVLYHTMRHLHQMKKIASALPG